MPRQPRVDIPGALHHVICRGIERRKIFRNDADRDDFLCRLVEVTTKTSTRCYAWSLLPNHFHLLLRTGDHPLGLTMQRVLTGYATTFNHRHQRHGHLFQNRYKSIVCQEEAYLLELIRYIHLNPLRAGIVSSLQDLHHYPYCGHSCIMGFNSSLGKWKAVKEILERFGNNEGDRVEAYAKFIADGVSQGRRPELTGGGLVRSAGGWHELITACRSGIFLKSDERILGDSAFVDNVLDSVEEQLERKADYARRHIDVDTLAEIVANLLTIDIEDVWASGKQRNRVEARSVLCYWAVRELGVTETALSKRLGVTQPAVTLSVTRGERLVAEKGWVLQELLPRNL